MSSGVELILQPPNNLWIFHIVGLALVVGEDVALYPLKVGLFCSVRRIPQTNGVTDWVKELKGLRGCGWGSQ